MLHLRSCTEIIRAILTAALLFSTVGSLRAETKPIVSDVGVAAPKTYLFVGNSFMYYNNSMHNHFLRLARAADKENRRAYRGTSVTISGSGLNWHDMESYFRPGALASYSFVAGNKIRFNKFEKPYEVVIMMDCSQCPVHPQLKGLFHEYAAKHSQTVVKHGARPVLFMSWAYEDKPEMTAGLAEEYTIAGNKNNMLVIPAGLAFAKARSKMPDLTLYQSDKRHPSLAGTYLSALTVYAAIYKKSPVGSAVPKGVEVGTGKMLQEVAWETVQEYFDM